MIKIEQVSKEYKTGDGAFFALTNINLNIAKGEFVSILGPSGSGKSTLLHLIGGLDQPSQGSVEVEGRNLGQLRDRELALFRNQKIGFVFQSFQLLPRIKALDNVILPLIYGLSPSDRKSKASLVLDRLGLREKSESVPAKLSGGEQQRVAIARAIINDPEIILADEPTGNLDSQNGTQILGILKELNADGKTIILVTHDENLTKASNRIIKIKDGQIEL